MKVLLVNGSPHEEGCTYRALKEVEKILNKNNIQTEIIWLGNKPISGCIGCNICLKDNKCFRNDIVNEFLIKAKEADGFVFGSPVHFAAISGALSSFMDRVFYGRTEIFKNKPACGIVSCRRGGASSAFEQINKYFSMSNMPIVTSQYWNQVHGTTKEEVEKDLEGMQTMRTLGNNMAWILKCIEIAKKSGLEYPINEKTIKTNFIK